MDPTVQVMEAFITANKWVEALPPTLLDLLLDYDRTIDVVDEHLWSMTDEAFLDRLPRLVAQLGSIVEFPRRSTTFRIRHEIVNPWVPDAEGE